MKKITKLTAAQQAAMPAYRDKWIAIGLRTGETDWATFEKAIPICYAKAGVPYPSRVVRVNSPLVGALASMVAKAIWEKIKLGGVFDLAVDSAVSSAVSSAVGSAVRSAVGSAVESAVESAVDSAVESAVSSAVSSAVGSAVRSDVESAVRSAVESAVESAVDLAVDSAVGPAVGSAVESAVESAVDSAVGSAVDSAVGSAVRSAVGPAVGSAVESAVRSAVESAVRSAVRPAVSSGNSKVIMEWHYWLGGQFWVGGYYWYGCAFSNFFFDVCGLRLSKDLMERAHAYRQICESVNYIWPNRNFVMVCARPSAIHRDPQGRLHSEHGKSIYYPDGWGLYHLHGVRFDEALYTKVVTRTMTAKEILQIPDIDQRVQAMKFAKDGYRDWFLSEKGTKRDAYQKVDAAGRITHYELWKIPQGGTFTQDVQFALYECPSSLARNEQREYAKGVPVELSTIPEVMAWGMSSEDCVVSPTDWELMMPLRDES